jgi:hypothetical protein
MGRRMGIRGRNVKRRDRRIPECRRVRKWPPCGKPIVLHALLHAWPFSMPPDELRNSEIPRSYNPAEDGPMCSAGETHNGGCVSTYLSSDE